MRPASRRLPSFMTDPRLRAPRRRRAMTATGVALLGVCGGYLIGLVVVLAAAVWMWPSVNLSSYCPGCGESWYDTDLPAVLLCAMPGALGGAVVATVLGRDAVQPRD